MPAYKIVIEVEWHSKNQIEAEEDLLDEISNVESILWRTTGYKITAVEPGKEIFKKKEEQA